MPKTLEITDEAQSVLQANLREGYSRKRLASEAIIEKYGCPKHLGAANEAKGGGNPAGFAANLVQALGTPCAALRHLDDYIKTEDERRNVRNVLIDMLETETISKGGK